MPCFTVGIMKRAVGIAMAAALAFAACTNRDERINEAVKARLASEPTPLAQLDVSTKDRIVRLDGVVATQGERERVERIVRDMDDVLAVDNRLTVQRPVQTTGGTRWNFRYDLSCGHVQGPVHFGLRDPRERKGIAS
jgi:hypothetical protein